jgi:hypothetical protein
MTPRIQFLGSYFFIYCLGHRRALNLHGSIIISPPLGPRSNEFAPAVDQGDSARPLYGLISVMEMKPPDRSEVHGNAVLPVV